MQGHVFRLSEVNYSNITSKLKETLTAVIKTEANAGMACCLLLCVSRQAWTIGDVIGYH